MLKLRQLDLQLALACPGPLRENIKNQRRPIQYLAIENSLQVAALGGRKLVVEDHGIHIRPSAMLREFIRLAFADESSSARRGKLLQTIAHNLAPCGRGQLGKFLQGLLQIGPIAGLKLNPYKKNPFCPPITGL